MAWTKGRPNSAASVARAACTAEQERRLAAKASIKKKELQTVAAAELAAETKRTQQFEKEYMAVERPIRLEKLALVAKAWTTGRPSSAAYLARVARTAEQERRLAAKAWTKKKELPTDAAEKKKKRTQYFQTSTFCSRIVSASGAYRLLPLWARMVTK